MSKLIDPKERVGVFNKNRFGNKMIVHEYINPVDIWVKFIDTDELIHTTWQSFNKGSVKSLYDRTIYGIGYIGEGRYKVTINGVYTNQYICWCGMMQRCYSESFQNRNASYKDCKVAEEWHSFQNFAKWFDENYYEVDGEKMSLDKDILIKGNRIYSSSTCIFTPQLINSLFIKNNSLRGRYPIGVNFHESYNYRACCNDGNGKRIVLGHYDTQDEAFKVYKTYKEKIIKQIANKYKDKIPFKLYNSLINYQIEIED